MIKENFEKLFEHLNFMLNLHHFVLKKSDPETLTRFVNKSWKFGPVAKKKKNWKKEYLTDGHTCSLPLGNPHYLSGKQTFFKHQILCFAHKIGFEKFSFFDSHYPFCTSQNWNWFWMSKYVFFCIILQCIFFGKKR